MLSLTSLLAACLLLSATSALIPLPYLDEFQKVISTSLAEKSAQQCDNFEMMRCANVYFKSLGFFRPPQSFAEFFGKVTGLLSSADPATIKRFCSSTNAFGSCYGGGLVNDCLNTNNLQNLGIRHKEAQSFSAAADLYAYMCSDAAYPILHSHWECMHNLPGAAQTMLKQCLATLLNETQSQVPVCQAIQHYTSCLQRAFGTGCGEDMGLVFCHEYLLALKLVSVEAGLKQCPCLYCDQAASQANPLRLANSD